MVIFPASLLLISKKNVNRSIRFLILKNVLLDLLGGMDSGATEMSGQNGGIKTVTNNQDLLDLLGGISSNPINVTPTPTSLTLTNVGGSGIYLDGMGGAQLPKSTSNFLLFGFMNLSLCLFVVVFL